jgi:hypothetical protein
MVGMEPMIPPRPDGRSRFDWEGIDRIPPSPRRRPRGAALVASFVAAALVVAGIAGSITATKTIAPKGSSRDYKFLAVIGGEPVRWNPCQPIHYTIDAGAAPDGSVDDVYEAIRRISSATGITFVFDGPTTEIPRRDRPSYEPERYGNRWAPVVIAWVTPGQTDIPFSGNGHAFVAVARPLTAPDDPRQFVSGWIVLNAQHPDPPGWSDPGDAGPTLLHELGHIMGLNHVASKAELMEPSGGLVTDFGPGDRQGLALLGRPAGCLVEPAPAP